MFKKFLSVLISLTMVLTTSPLSMGAVEEISDASLENSGVFIEKEDSDTSYVPVTAMYTADEVPYILNTTLAQLADTVKEPSFGTNAGEWTVLCLARGEYFDKDDKYFTDYYDRIVTYVNEKAASLNLNGALHKSKSTDNSRLIIALSSIGKDSTFVGNWNLITPYNDFNWVKKQGINGVIYTLIALDTADYQTTDSTIRRQCIDHLLNKQLEGGGWAMSGTSFNVDITAMVLQALYPYRNEEEVKNAAEKAFERLSVEQLQTGGFLYGSGETSESTAQVIVACATWGIDPDSDMRFIKNGISAVENLLSYYVEDDAMFKHVHAGDSNDMATDQATYALIAYDRFLNGEMPLYDMSDVDSDENIGGGNDEDDRDYDTITPGVPKVTLSLPAKITGEVGETFNATISIDQWDNDKGYKLIDLVLNVPNGIAVTNVSTAERLLGGDISYNLEKEANKLRIVYFDANNHNDIVLSGESFPSQLFTITFRVESSSLSSKLKFSIGGMSLKLNSDYADDESMVVADTDNAKATVSADNGYGESQTAVCLYTGDDIDLIPSNKKAVAVFLPDVRNTPKVTFDYGEYSYEFKYNGKLSAKTGIATYVAIVDESIEMSHFISYYNFTIDEKTDASRITFGDVNNDEVVNAQDALAAVDSWLRKTSAPSDDEILALNVNGDSRINTFDALGIVEAFVDGSDYLVVTKALNLTTTY